MNAPRVCHLAGLDALSEATTLLQRVRTVHPTAGLYQAAELQWWWRDPRPTDDLLQIFWCDDHGEPVATVLATDWGDGGSLVYGEVTLAVIVLPDATPEWTTHVVERGLAHVADAGIGAVELEVARTDHVVRSALAGHGFVRTGDGVIEAWLAVIDRPEVSRLAPGYRLRTRVETADRPHHFAVRDDAFDEDRLRQMSLYDPGLDLVVLDPDDGVAAYGLFWFDPVTATGVVEPMRTMDDHQRRGLARHVLTAGVDRLAAAGATRISIGWEPGNPASDHLYRSVGFEPVVETDLFGGPTRRPDLTT